MWPLWELKGTEEMKHFVQPHQDEAGNCGNQWIFKGFSQVTGQKDRLWTCVFQPENESLHSAVTCFLYLLCWWWSRSWQQLGPGKIFAPTPSWRSLFGNPKLEGGWVQDLCEEQCDCHRGWLQKRMLHQFMNRRKSHQRWCREKNQRMTQMTKQGIHRVKSFWDCSILLTCSESVSAQTLLLGLTHSWNFSESKVRP